MKKRQLHIFALVLLTAGFVFIFSGAVANAQTVQVQKVTVSDTNDFVVQPGKMEIVVNPGDKIIRNITIYDRIQGESLFVVSTEDFIGSSQADRPIDLLGEEKSPYSFKDNIHPAVKEVKLTYGDQLTLPVEIDVPADARPGGYYASVLIANKPIGDVSSQAVARLVTRLGVLFFIRVNGPVNESGSLEDFRIAGPSKWVYDAAPSGMQILFNNTGTVHLTPFGSINIKNMLGKSVATIPVDAYFAMPNSLRYRDIAWQDPGLRFGRYTATLSLNRGYGGNMDTRTIAMWIIPWKLALIAFAVIVIIVGGIILFFRKFKLSKRSDNQDLGTPQNSQ